MPKSIQDCPAALCLALCWPMLLSSTNCSSRRIPKDALLLAGPTLSIRQQSTRRFDTKDEAAVLSASAGLLQDLGFTIDESETDLGLIVASKDRSAVHAGQVIGKVAARILLRTNIAIDKNQKFRASVVTKPIANQIFVRVTFQRIVWNDRGQVARLERLDDPKQYQEFFDALAKAVFLEAHQLGRAQK